VVAAAEAAEVVRSAIKKDYFLKIYQINMKKYFLSILTAGGLIAGAWLFVKQSSSPPVPFSDNKQDVQITNQTNSLLPSPVQTEKNFFGERGEQAVFTTGEVKLDAAQFSDNQAHFYNIEMPDGKIIYFFVVKDKNGVYRAAANACAVCFTTYKGFRQEGDEIVCNNCGNRYPIEKIATEKGGCNPGPINPDLEVRGGEIIVKQADIEKVVELF